MKHSAKRPLNLLTYCIEQIGLTKQVQELETRLNKNLTNSSKPRYLAWIAQQ